jgi:hypothetical protein
VDNVNVTGMDNDEYDIAIAGVDNDNVNAVNNQNEQKIDTNINPEQLNPEQQIDNEPDPNIDLITDEQHGPRSDAYNLRTPKPRDYSHLHAPATVLTQHSLKTGIKLFGSATSPSGSP